MSVRLAKISLIGWVILSLLFMVIGLMAYFALISPIAFQKSVSIKVQEGDTFHLAKKGRYVDIGSLVCEIPYQGGSVYEVYPKAKHRETLIHGRGNCSNLAFGLAYHLEQESIEYQIVYLLPPGCFLRGGGHTVMNAPFTHEGEQKVGIIDLLEGGLPQAQGDFLTVNSLREGGLEDPRILSLSANIEGGADTYRAFLDNSVVGVVAGEEVGEYFRFIELLHFPLGHKKLEKIFFDVMAIIFGYYPTTYVDDDGFSALFDSHRILLTAAYFLLYAVRLLLIVVFACSTWMIISRLYFWHAKAQVTKG